MNPRPASPWVVAILFSLLFSACGYSPIEAKSTDSSQRLVEIGQRIIEEENYQLLLEYSDVTGSPKDPDEMIDHIVAQAMGHEAPSVRARIRKMLQQPRS